MKQIYACIALSLLSLAAFGQQKNSGTATIPGGAPTRAGNHSIHYGWNSTTNLSAIETEQAPSDRYVGFIHIRFHYDAAAGGINNYNGLGGTKTDYFNLMADSKMRTVGQKTGIASKLSSFSGGDTMGITSYVTQYGGYDTSGDEQTEGVRVQVQQGSTDVHTSGGIFEGTVNSIIGSTLTYTPRYDEDTLGEHRIVRDLDRSYAQGSIASIANSGGSPNTVTITGRGTHWSRLGLGMHTRWNDLDAAGNVTSANLALCFDPLRNEGYDMCFPVSRVLDDTHLTINLLSSGPAENTFWPPAWPSTGRYEIYHAAWPTSVDLAAHTLTAPDLSGIVQGDRIDQVLAYNTMITGELIVTSRHIGFPGQGGGLKILNTSTASSPLMEFGVSISGRFDSAIDVQSSNQQSGIPSYFATLHRDPGSGVLFNSVPTQKPLSEVALWRLRDTVGGNHNLLRFDRNSVTACVLDSSLCVSADGSVTARQFTQNESNDYAGIVAITKGTSARVSFRAPFHAPPVCTLTPTSDPTEAGAYWVSATPLAVIAHTTRAGTISFSYICVGNPD